MQADIERRFIHSHHGTNLNTYRGAFTSINGRYQLSDNLEFDYVGSYNNTNYFSDLDFDFAGIGDANEFAKDIAVTQKANVLTNELRFQSAGNSIYNFLYGVFTANNRVDNYTNFVPLFTTDAVTPTKDFGIFTNQRFALSDIDNVIWASVTRESKSSATAISNYDLHFGSLDAYLRANAVIRDKSYFPQTARWLPGYTQINAYVGVKSEANHWEVSLWAKNLFNKVVQDTDGGPWAIFGVPSGLTFGTVTNDRIEAGVGLCSTACSKISPQSLNGRSHRDRLDGVTSASKCFSSGGRLTVSPFTGIGSVFGYLCASQSAQGPPD